MNRPRNPILLKTRESPKGVDCTNLIGEEEREREGERERGREREKKSSFQFNPSGFMRCLHRETFCKVSSGVMYGKRYGAVDDSVEGRWVKGADGGGRGRRGGKVGGA